MSDNNVQSLIIGHKGQDGKLLRQQLNAEGLTWVGIDQGVIDTNAKLGACFASSIDVTDISQVRQLINWCKPAEIYYLAAIHKSSKSQMDNLGEFSKASLEINVHGPLNFLMAIESCSPQSRFIYASSSLVYKPTGSPDELINESYPKMPAEAYGYEKSLAGHYCKQFAQHRGIFASVAILFNHESQYRPEGFFTRQATDAIAKISRSQLDAWEVGSLDAIVDWSYAGDTVNAMRHILRLENPGEFIISSGVGHTTGEFISLACQYAGVDMASHIKCNRSQISRINSCRIGDNTKLLQQTGWKPTITFDKLVEHLMQAAIDRLDTESCNGDS